MSQTLPRFFVPYAALSDSEKEMDRNIVREAVEVFQEMAEENGLTVSLVRTVPFHRSPVAVCLFSLFFRELCCHARSLFPFRPLCCTSAYALLHVCSLTQSCLPADADANAGDDALISSESFDGARTLQDTTAVNLGAHSQTEPWEGRSANNLSIELPVDEEPARIHSAGTAGKCFNILSLYISCESCEQFNFEF